MRHLVRDARPAPAYPGGRLTLLVVDEAARRRGVARALILEVEARCRALGCGLLEVTSNKNWREAHAMYRRLGFDETSFRFARPID
jgi:GNAT superfamily N-acetyltransferase